MHSHHVFISSLLTAEVPKTSDYGHMPKIRMEDVASLTDFHRNSKIHLKRLKLSGRPEVLTINGKAELVVQDAAAYQRLLDAVERAEQVLRKK